VRSPLVVMTGSRRRAGKRIGDHLTDAGWEVVRWEPPAPLPATVDAVVHVDGDDSMTRALVEIGATVVIVLAHPGQDHADMVTWCEEQQVEAVVVDATKKIHELAPLVRGMLSG
jgi:hypothetical protein